MKHIDSRKYVVLVFTILVSIGCFFLNLLQFDDSKSIDFYFFKVGSFGFYNIPQLLDYSKMKFLIIFYSSIWYLLSKYWWKNAILVIISIEIMKLVTALNANNEYYDEIDFITSLPITVPIILLLFYLSKKLSNYNKYIDYKTDIDTEIDNLLNELNTKQDADLLSLEQSFNNLKSKKNALSPLGYLKKLENLKTQYYE